MEICLKRCNLFIFVSCQHHNINNQPTSLCNACIWLYFFSSFFYHLSALAHPFTLFNNICLRHSPRLYLPSKTNDTNIYFFAARATVKRMEKNEEKSKRVIKELLNEMRKKMFELMWRYKEKRWPLPIPYYFLQMLYFGATDASVNCTWRTVSKNDGEVLQKMKKWLILTFFPRFFSSDRHSLASNRCIGIGCAVVCHGVGDGGVSMNFFPNMEPISIWLLMIK